MEAFQPRVLPGFSSEGLTGYADAGVPKLAVNPLSAIPRSFLDATSLSDASGYVLGLIHAKDVDAATASVMMRDTIHNWNTHINPGFLRYRKSVAEADGYAALEWRDGKPGGCTVIDASGKEYIDLLGGFGIYSCGHSHPVIVQAVHAQLAKQPLHSQELLDPLRAYCASILCRTMPGPALRAGYVFFTNSGTESVEACLKFAMLSTRRRHFVGVIGAFHGKSLGSLSGTSKAAFRQPFAGMGCLLPFTHIKINDISALRAAFESARFTGNEIAGLLVEPVLGEGGIHVCSDEFLREGRRLCDEYGARLIFDEVQCGMGRTGTWWACEHAGVCPDLMAIAKGFGGGVMGAGAAVGTEAVMSTLFDNPFIHTTTFGGNPLSLAAAIAAMHVTDTEGLPANAVARGDELVAGIRTLAGRYPHLLKEVRGRGLMLGMEFHTDEIGYAFSKGVFARGCLLSGMLIAARVLRVEPPLTITAEEVAVVLDRFADTLAAMHAAGLGAAGRVPAAAEAAVAAATVPVPQAAEAIAAPQAARAPNSEATAPSGSPPQTLAGSPAAVTVLPVVALAGPLELSWPVAAAAAPEEEEEEEVGGVIMQPPALLLSARPRGGAGRPGPVVMRRLTTPTGRDLVAAAAATAGVGLLGSGCSPSAAIVTVPVEGSSSAPVSMACGITAAAALGDDESDVSSVSSTSTESGGMDTEDSEAEPPASALAAAKLLQ